MKGKEKKERNEIKGKERKRKKNLKLKILVGKLNKEREKIRKLATPVGRFKVSSTKLQNYLKIYKDT